MDDLMVKMKIRLSCALVSASSILLAGCPGDAPQGGGAPASRPATADTPASRPIVVASTSDIRDVNELTATPSQTHTMLHQHALFLPLLEEQPDYASGPPTLKPRLAESWEMSEDRLVLTFHLRKDVIWSDGIPVTAEDVRWSWQAQTSPEVAWVQVDDKKLIRDVEVVDAHTVRFHFTRPSATQVLDANSGVTLPRHVWSKVPFSEWRERAEWFRENLVVNGPYTLESWEPSQRFVLKRNERYYEPGLPRTERIVVRIVRDRMAQMAMLKAGEAHMIDWGRPGDAAEFEENPDVVLKSFLPRTFYSLTWNMRNPLFTSRNVRLALTLGIDRQAIVDLAYYGYAKVPSSPYLSNTWVRNHDVEPWPYDPGRAAELLAEDGWSDSDSDGVLDKDGQPFRFAILTAAENELRQDILVMVQEQLRRIGVAAEQRTIEHNTMITRIIEHDFDVAFVGLAIPTNFDLFSIFHTSAADGEMNFGVYSDPELDRVLEEIQQEVDPFAAKPLFDRLQVLLHEQLPATFLYEPQRLVPVRKELLGTRPNPLTTYFGLREWELAPNGEP